MIKKLKSQKGITLISLIVYVIVMLIVVTIIGTITSYFYANVNDHYQESKDDNGENTLDMYLTNDLKNHEIAISFVNPENNVQIKLEYNDDSYIIYTIAANPDGIYGIYRDKVKIYSGDTNPMAFELTDINTGVLQEKQQFKIMKGTDIFKSYTINTTSKAIYETTSEN